MLKKRQSDELVEQQIEINESEITRGLEKQQFLNTSNQDQTDISKCSRKSLENSRNVSFIRNYEDNDLSLRKSKCKTCGKGLVLAYF